MELTPRWRRAGPILRFGPRQQDAAITPRLPLIMTGNLVRRISFPAPQNPCFWNCTAFVGPDRPLGFSPRLCHAERLELPLPRLLGFLGEFLRRSTKPGAATIPASGDHEKRPCPGQDSLKPRSATWRTSLASPTIMRLVPASWRLRTDRVRMLSARRKSPANNVHRPRARPHPWPCRNYL